MFFVFLQRLSVCPEDESVILSSFYNTIAGLSVKQGNVIQKQFTFRVNKLIV